MHIGALQGARCNLYSTANSDTVTDPAQSDVSSGFPNSDVGRRLHKSVQPSSFTEDKATAES